MIKITNLTKKIWDKILFSDFNFEVKIWEMVILDWKSWVWKTTILKIVSWLDRDYSWSVEVDWVDLSKLSIWKLSKFRRENIWIVFQFFNLYQNITVYENITFLSNFYYLWEDVFSWLDNILKKLWIFELKYKNISKLSWWELQRVAIARALFNKTKILLLDEPTSNLDNENTKLFFEILEQIKKDYSLTVLCVAHDDYTKTYFSKIINIW